MNLPRLNAGNALRLQNTFLSYGSAGQGQRTGAGVAPLVSLNCLENCGGADLATRCWGLCGTDGACWTDCAGPGVAQCVAQCF